MTRRDPIPALPGEKGRRYLCQDSDGQWFYLNHGRTWQTCPAAGDEPGSPPENEKSLHTAGHTVTQSGSSR